MSFTVGTTRLTGRIYYRKGLFGRLLLQVEEECSNKLGVLTITYRDADLKDAAALGILNSDYTNFIRRQVGLEPWLTGQARHRSCLFSGRAVLQVEALDGGYVQATYFKNASVKDISPQLLEPLMF